MLRQKGRGDLRLFFSSAVVYNGDTDVRKREHRMERVAVLRRNGLGDFICATVPLCKCLAEKYGAENVWLFMSEQNAGLAEKIIGGV